MRRVRATVVAALVLALPLTGCSLFGDDSEDASVFDVEPGQCFLTPDEVKAQVSDLTRVGCDEPHDQEAYALVAYQAPDGAEEDVYPGGEAPTAFAQGRCAEEFRPYVGVDYLDSSLYFTYLLPSARSWQDSDRTVICLVIGTGRRLEGSVKGSAK